MGDPEGVLGGLAGGGAAVFLPKMDLALVARNTPVLDSGGGVSDVTVHPAESVQLSLLDEGAKKTSRKSAFSILGRSMSSLFGDGGSSGAMKGSEELRSRKLSLKAVFKEGQSVVQLADLASPQRRLHDVTLPPSLGRLAAVRRAQELDCSDDPVARWVVSGSVAGGRVVHGLLSFDLESEMASFTELSMESAGPRSVFTGEGVGAKSHSAWKAESLPLSVTEAPAVPYDNGGISSLRCDVVVGYC